MDVESGAVVLSAAVLQFDTDKTYTYEELLNYTFFVKFNLKEQIQKYNRTTSKDTISWWKSQSEECKKVSFYPLSTDDHLVDGLNKIRQYVNSFDDEKIVWVRGTLDQITFNSLCRSAGVAPIFPFKNYMEMRTGINLLKETAKNGYCEVPDFYKDVVIKHDPRHDVAYDALMLLKGK